MSIEYEGKWEDLEIIEKIVHEPIKGGKPIFPKKMGHKTINDLNERTLQYSLHVGHTYIFQKNLGIPWTSYAEVRGPVLNRVYKMNYYMGMIKSYRELYPVIPIHHILKDELLVICKGTNLYREVKYEKIPVADGEIDIPTESGRYREPIRDDQIYRFEYGAIDDCCLYIERQGFVDNIYDKNYIDNSDCRLDEFKKETIWEQIKDIK